MSKPTGFSIADLQKGAKKLQNVPSPDVADSKKIATSAESKEDTAAIIALGKLISCDILSQN